MAFIQFQLRRGLASEWTSADPTLAAGEIGVETDTGQFKVGDGATAWTALAYGGLVGPTGPTGAAGEGVAVGGTTGQALVKTSNTNYATEWDTIDADFVGATPDTHLTDSDPHSQYLTETEADALYDVIGSAASAQSAAESYADSAVAALVDSAPGTLDTLNELAAALGDDPNFATTIAGQIGDKADKTGTQTFTGSQTFIPASISSVPVLIKGVSGQTANLLELKDSADIGRFLVNPDGYVTALNVQAGSGVKIGTSVSYTTGQRWVSIQNAASNPAAVSDGVIVYVEGGVLKWRTPTATVSTGDIVFDSDSRLTDDRNPTAHASSHAAGGADEVTPAAIGAAPVRAALNDETGTTYTLALTDENKVVTLDNAAAITVTVPTNTAVAFPVGSKVDLLQIGAGQVTVAGDSGVTVQTAQTLALRAQWSGASLLKIDTDVWVIVGDLEAA